MYHACTKSNFLLQVFFSCMCLHRHDRKNRRGAGKARSESFQRGNIRDGRKGFSGSVIAQMEAMIAEKTADLVSRDTRNRTGRLLRGNVGGKDMDLAPEPLLKHSRNEQVLPSRTTATKKENILRPRKKEKYEEEDPAEGEYNIDDKQAGVLRRGLKKQELLKKKVFFE